jgi:hypothetical protein
VKLLGLLPAVWNEKYPTKFWPDKTGKRENGDIEYRIVLVFNDVLVKNFLALYLSVQLNYYFSIMCL